MRARIDFLSEPLRPLRGGPAAETMLAILCSAGLPSTAAPQLWHSRLCSHLARDSLPAIRWGGTPHSELGAGEGRVHT